MSCADPELVDHFWARVDLLAMEAENGELATSELKLIIDEAIAAFAKEGHLESQLQTLIGDLFATREAYREQRPAYASVFARAAMLASNSTSEIA